MSISDFQFDATVAAAFDNMVSRSVPFYDEMQRMVVELATDFSEPGSRIYDLGCSTATTLTQLDRTVDPEVHFVGIDNSAEMLAKAHVKLDKFAPKRRVDLVCQDLHEGLHIEDASVVMLVLTLQFVRPLYRERIIRRIAEGVRHNGALILIEKLVVSDSRLNRLYIEHYYGYKRSKGYSDIEITKNVRHSKIPIGDFFFKWRNQIFPLFMLSLIIVPPAQGAACGIDEYLLDIVGILAMLAGEALRIGVVGLKYIRRGGLKKKVYADDLVTGGFFTVCRNPLYVGNILISVGALLIHAQPVLMVGGIAATLFIYVAIVATEENFLRNKFGAAYDAYCADVNRWLPNLARLPAASGGMAFNLRRVVAKEYPTAAGVAVGIIVLQIHEEYRIGGVVPQMSWVAIAVVIAVVLGVRTAKKAGYFND